MNYKKIISMLTFFCVIIMISSTAKADFSMNSQATSTRDLTVEQRPMANLNIRPGKLKVSAWVDHKDNTYRAGENVVLSVKANMDAYLTILDVGTSGKVHIIFPNKYQKNNRIRAGQIIKVPGKNAGFDFRVGGPSGTELIKVIATTSPKHLIDEALTSPAGPYKSVKKPAKDLAKDLMVVIRQDTRSDYAEYNKVIKIVADSAQAAPHVPAATGTRPQPGIPAAPVSGTFAPSPVQVHNNDNVPFALHLRTDKNVYRIGEKVRIMATAEKDCQLTILDVGTSGQVHVLFPNRYQPDNRVRAGQTIVIPADTAPVNYVLNGPEGVEALIGICRTDGKPVYTGAYNFGKNAYQPWGPSRTIIKDLAAVLRQPAGVVAHASVTFLVTR